MQEVVRNHYLLPERLQGNGSAQVTTRKIGIFEIPVYQSQLRFSGYFSPGVEKLLQRTDGSILEPYLILLISYPRGIGQIPVMQVAGSSIPFQGGIRNTRRGNGIHVNLPKQLLQEQKVEFSFSLALNGTKRLSVIPVGRDSQFQLSSDWPHPNFLGGIFTLQAFCYCTGVHCRLEKQLGRQ